MKEQALPARSTAVRYEVSLIGSTSMLRGGPDKLLKNEIKFNPNIATVKQKTCLLIHTKILTQKNE